MKRFNIYAILLVLITLSFYSCKDDSSDIDPDLPNELENKHFDIWSPIGGSAGMGKLDIIVKQTESLDTGIMDFQGSGVDISEKLMPAVIVDGEHYYHLSKDARFGKYEIENDKVEVEQEIPFPTLKDRRYAHTWLDDETLLLVGSNGSSNKILWVKIDTDDMIVLSEGELDLPQPPAGQKYSTSGMVAYRKADDMILYSFIFKKLSKDGTVPTPEFYMSFINNVDMTTVKTVTEDRADKMASTAYGELRQNKSFFDEKGDYYIACNTVLPNETTSTGKVTTTAQHGSIFRIKNGQLDFDKNYNGYTEERGKIVTMTYMKNRQAILYMQDPMHTTNTKIWDSKTNPYVFYWIIVDLDSKEFNELNAIPHCKGNFSQLAKVINDKVYIGVNPENKQSSFYIYNKDTKNITEGLKLANGYTIERFELIEN